jgi:hypothetical protein
MPLRWLHTVSLPMIEAEKKMAKQSLDRGSPPDSEAWVKKTADTLNLEHTLRPPDRPEGWRKRPEKLEKSRQWFASLASLFIVPDGEPPKSVYAY